MAPGSYKLAEVLVVAQTHPFYNKQISYPPNSATISRYQELAIDHKKDFDFQRQPLLDKKTLYNTIARLTHDVNPQNTYRQASYMSITGGGSGGVPMMFAVDVHENRRQRAQMGGFLRLCGVIHPADVVLSTHFSGGFYRSLDLTTEIMENAGATVFSAGSYMPHIEVVMALANYHVNVLTGDGSQVIQIVHQISKLSQEDRKRIVLNKIIYTSEPLTCPQRVFIKTIISDVRIYSIMGSAEAGPWAISSPDLIGEQNLAGHSTDFIFDTRSMMIEIFSSSVLDGATSPDSQLLSEGETGLMVQTSLQRLRNPLVRYISGDVGSIHPLPETAYAVIPEADQKHLRVLRMHGRDHRFSFKWYAVYFEFSKIDTFMQETQFGILQWQIILDRLIDTPQSTLEIRLLRSPPRDGVVSDEALRKFLESFFVVLPENEHLVQILFIDSLEGFERSGTSGKVIKFVDRWN
ncbi:hypothetical protein SBOR_9159 [Sclerotinia borealis F-4128]|uniref:AMP-dependent synthetase/ligase domain-containing protein n=1 Tax=Sclerotinia borealis (strain F-4128) TaxID=1432307 RepID=W9C7C9_SCLBF|nr:hypothetical protein SBOR_9159 [Sclerotinia borealis F-4128]